MKEEEPVCGRLRLHALTKACICSPSTLPGASTQSSMGRFSTRSMNTRTSHVSGVTASTEPSKGGYSACPVLCSSQE